MEFNPNDAVTVRLDDDLPDYPSFAPGIRRAPRREAKLSQADKTLAIRNALRSSPAGSTATASAPRESSTASPLRSTRETAWRPVPSR